MDKIIRLLHRLQNYSIRTKLMVIISGLVLTSLLLLIAIAIGIFQDDMTNMVSLLNSRTTKLLSEKVESEINYRSETLKLIYRLQTTRGGQEAALAIIKANPQIWSASAIDSQGDIRYFFHSAGNSGIPADKMRAILLEDSGALKKARTGGTVLRNISAKTGRATIALYTPLLKDGRILEAVMIAALNPEALRLAFSIDASRSKSANALYTSLLTDREGNLIVHPDEQEIKKAAQSDNPAVARINQINARNGVIRYEWHGERQFGAFQKLSIGDLVVITTMNENRALEGVTVAKIRSLLIALLIISLAILFIYFFSKTISEPLKNLVHATHRIREGHYDIHLKAKYRDEIGELTNAFNHMNEGLKERETLKGAFGKFVNPEIARQILAGGLTLGGETKEVTVFFSDIRSFTAISENLEPHEVVEFLNEYMTLMVTIIHNTHGVVDKFIGDAIMAVWGAPVSKGNDAENCILAALKMRETLLQFNKGRGTPQKPIIKIGCGICSGPVLAGQIGSEDRLEYTVIGDTVNLASRIESLNKPFGTDILISETTYRQIGKKFKTVPMQKIKVKGKSTSQQIYAVLGRADDANAPKSLKELQKLIGAKPQLKSGKAPFGEEQKYEIIP